MFKWTKKFNVLLVLLAVIVSVAWFSLCFADMTDKATLGGQDSSNHYSWRVDSNHNLIPGTTNQNNIGGTSNVVAGIYVLTITASGNATISGNLSVTGTTIVTGKTSLNGGINWDAMKAAIGSGINWTDAYLTGTGINWTDVKINSCISSNCSTSAINWQAFAV